MKFKVIYFTGLVMFSFLSLFSFSSGPTGSLGDRTGRTGTSCNQCHSAAGSFTPSVSLQVRDASQNLVTNGEYIPGDSYTLTFTVSATGSPNSFGIQAVVVDSINENQAGTLANASTGASGTGTNAKITTSGGRQYLEHSARNSNGIFNVAWTAPAVGTGTVEMYAAGLSINGSGSTGDDLANVTFSLAEATVNSVNIVTNDLDYNFYPNPVINRQVFVQGIEGEATVSLIDLSGRVLMSKIKQLQNGQVTLLPTNIPTGVYQLSIRQKNKQSSQKLFIH